MYFVCSDNVVRCLILLTIRILKLTACPYSYGIFLCHGFLLLYEKSGSRDSVVGIATSYGLDD
jgi:hypothetical protein